MDETRSEKQVDFSKLKIQFLISTIATGSNKEKTGAGILGKENGLTSINRRLAWRDLNLSVKNELNWWAESEAKGYFLLSYNVKLCPRSTRDILYQNSWQIAKKNNSTELS